MKPVRYLAAIALGAGHEVPDVVLHGFTIVHQCARAKIYVRDGASWRDGPVVGSVIVGQLFDAKPSHHETDRGRDQEGEGLKGVLKTHWGSYVAIRYEEQIEIIRDPSGTLPCLFTVHEDILYCASDAELLFQASGQRPQVSWENLAALLYLNELPVEMTALDGIRELLAGFMLETFGAELQSKPIWNPWDFTQQTCPEPSTLAEVVHSAVNRWAQGSGQNLVAVSGGLDSSIVAEALRRACVSVTAFNISTHDPHGDEAGYAQSLCRALGISLDCRLYEGADADVEQSTVPHLPRPGGRVQLNAFNRALKGAIQSAGAEMFFSGVGGDNIFYYTQSPRPLVDRYLSEGVTVELLSTLKDISQLTGSGWIEVLTHARAIYRQERAQYDWRTDGRFLHKERRDALAAQNFSHPWLKGPKTGLPGQVALISMILRTQRYVDGPHHDNDWCTIFPLLSQPVVETCLAIPSWRSCEGGRDRSFARTAFEEYLPTSVLNRRIKGGPDAFAFQLLRRHLLRIREILLQGALAEKNIIDVEQLDQALCEKGLMEGVDYVRILLLLDTEAWARHWIARGSAGPL